jgi:hypothetical protein
MKAEGGTMKSGMKPRTACRPLLGTSAKANANDDELRTSHFACFLRVRGGSLRVRASGSKTAVSPKLSVAKTNHPIFADT